MSSAATGGGLRAAMTFAWRVIRGRPGEARLVPPHPLRRDRCGDCGRPPPEPPRATSWPAECRTDLASLARRALEPSPHRARRGGSERVRRPSGAAAAAGTRGRAIQQRPWSPRGAAGDARARRPPADEERQTAQLACNQMVDHRRPRGIEVMRGSGRTPTRDPVGLLDERDAQTQRVRDVRRRNEILRLHPTACTVTEHERGPRLVCAVQIRLRRPEGRVDLELLHRADAATSNQSGRSGTVNPCSRPSRTARITAFDPNRRRTSSSATSRALPLKRSRGSTS